MSLCNLRLLIVGRYDLLDECRVLLVHGLLHLLGYDHEIGVEESMAMAAAECHILDALGWKVRSTGSRLAKWKAELDIFETPWPKTAFGMR